MTPVVVLVGVGEMGGVFARGLLKTGHTVTPVTRDSTMADIQARMPHPDAVVIAVGENDLPGILDSLPDSWRDRVIMLQNELLPGDWAGKSISEPTVISVWFEKKKNIETKVIVPSPAYGPHAYMLQSALGALDIPVTILDDEQQLLNELVLKNLYIVTTNVAGLKTGGNVGELWEHHRDLAHNVASDVLDIQEYLTGRKFDRRLLIDRMVACFEGDPQHMCMGRSAPIRLERALQQADEAGLKVSTIRKIAEEVSA